MKIPFDEVVADYDNHKRGLRLWSIHKERCLLCGASLALRV